jgi:membrane protein YqaA with SNARE-associated domain
MISTLGVILGSGVVGWLIGRYQPQILAWLATKPWSTWFKKSDQ